MDAVRKVVNTFDSQQDKNHFSRRMVILVTLDARDVFNSASWVKRIRPIEQKYKILPYLLRMAKPYLTDRWLLYDTTDKPRRKEITAEAAQRSILGLDLRNISHDVTVRLEMPSDMYLGG